MKAVVVEGPMDAALLDPLLTAAQLDGVGVRVAGSKSSALSLGPSIATLRRMPVAILVDGDTTDQRALDEQKLIFADLQRGIASGAPCELFLAAPTLEGELFPDPESFASTYGVKLTSRERDSFATDRRAFIGRYLARPARGTDRWHGMVDPTRAEDGWGRPLLRSLLSYLRPTSSARALPRSR